MTPLIRKDAEVTALTTNAQYSAEQVASVSVGDASVPLISVVLNDQSVMEVDDQVEQIISSSIQQTSTATNHKRKADDDSLSNTSGTASHQLKKTKICE